jgi:outer membrane receptor protein involved in Fe transport
MKKLLSVIFALFVGAVTMAQTTLTGSVKDAKTNQPIPGANITVVGKSIGTTADFDGNFSLKTSENPPFTLEISLMGYSSKKVEVTQSNQKVDIELSEVATALDEVVISASRTPERLLESPVSIEHMDVRAIRNTSSPSFYDGLENLKGVDVNSSSLTFKSINTRGFATFANSRFMQLLDGMDNSSPALNFNLGNLLGMSELDVNSIELLPGASSALYGANAFNGILFMTSKNPFNSPGVSVYVKTGLTSQKAAGDRNYADVGIRMAYKFSNKFAAKATFSYLKGTEWFATDYADYNNPGLTRNDPAYDGLNIYGDEVYTTLNFEQIALDNGVPAPIASMMGASTVSRTGYKEVDLMDYVAESAKASVALHYKPFDNNIEFIYNGKFGKGSTIYQGANRYSLKNFFMQQHKFEIRGDDFFARIYTTSEDAGDSYDSRFAAINLNRSWKSDPQWFTEYAGAYVNTFVGTILAGGTPNPSVISQQARAFAQTGALVPGTPAFKNALDVVTSDPNLATGAKFKDNTKIYHSDVNYNFHNLIDFADIQIGGSWREYSLNSAGTIFTDYNGAINYNEYGAYMQVQKKFVDDRLKFTGSIRYDKAKNFEGNYSPRVSFTYSLGENKTRNLRASFQTGFRNPTTQDQYIGLDVGRAFLVGSAPDNLDRYTTNPLSVSATGQGFFGLPSTIQLSGRAAYDNSFTLESVLAGAPVKANIALIKPEKITAFEVGYRAGFGSFMLDASAYYNDYKDFIGVKTVMVPYYGLTNFSDFDPNTMPAPPAVIALSAGDYKPFQVYTNSPADITSYGATIGIATRVFDHFNFGINYTLAKFDFDQSTDPDYEASFNTPEHKVKVSFGSENLFENLGFKIDYRWSDKYLWESTFADAIVAPRNVVDAQINYTISSIKSVFKIGGANIAGKEYVSAPGVGSVGSQYYVSWTINP